MDNSRRGAKFDRSLSTKEIAVRIRADIKGAKRTGEIADGVKVSVRYDSFAGGSAIRMKVTEVPAGFEIHNRAHVAFTTTHPHDLPPRDLQRYTPEAYELLNKLTRIALAYNRDDSDSSTDYFNTNFYGGDAGFDWQLEAAAKEAIVLIGPSKPGLTFEHAGVRIETTLHEVFPR